MQHGFATEAIIIANGRTTDHIRPVATVVRHMWVNVATGAIGLMVVKLVARPCDWSDETMLVVVRPSAIGCATFRFLPSECHTIANQGSRGGTKGNMVAFTREMVVQRCTSPCDQSHMHTTFACNCTTGRRLSCDCCTIWLAFDVQLSHATYRAIPCNVVQRSYDHYCDPMRPFLLHAIENEHWTCSKPACDRLRPCDHLQRVWLVVRPFATGSATPQKGYCKRSQIGRTTIVQGV